MSLLFIVFVILIILISVGLKIYLEYTEKHKNRPIVKRKVHILFPVHFTLATITLGLCAYWFYFGKNFFDYGDFWKIVERGNIEALTSALSIVGVSSILLGWIYSERDKLTLGKSQIDMIHYCFGLGYGGSIVVHFAISALAVLMLKCDAKEASLWAFFTVAWGCIPQASICLLIAMNCERREKLALQLWEQDGTIRGNQIAVIHRMAGYLGETEVRFNQKYSEALGIVIKNWLLEHYSQNTDSRGITEGAIKSASVIFRELVDKIPKEDRASFEEEILKTVCDLLDTDVDLEPERKNVAALLLGCGYIRFLYEQSKEKLNQRINRTMYFYQQGSSTYRNCLDWIQDFLCGLEWFLFLNQKTEIPRNATGKSNWPTYANSAFVQLILAIWDNKDLTTEKYAEISWQQVKLGGEL